MRLRNRQRRNFLATLMFSQGVPMLSHGDELGRTQRGNNNGYCQDNDLTWIDWNLSKEDAAHLEFTRQVVQMRKDHATLRRRRFFRGAASHGGESDLGRHRVVHPRRRAHDRRGMEHLVRPIRDGVPQR